MRKFVINSNTASTSPKISDLKGAGRIDILLHSIISAMFASNTYRDYVELHLILNGPPTPPRHITIKYNTETVISKKNLKKLIEVCLRKYKEGKTTEVNPGIFVDNMNIEEVVKSFSDEEVFMLDFTGNHIKNYSSEKLQDGVFVLGDYDGFDKKTKKFLKKNVNRLSLGEQIYFTSQSITIINYELDNL